MPDSVVDLAAFGFPLEPFEALLASLGWPEREAWIAHWQAHGGAELAREAWSVAPSAEWIWGLALPLLSQIEALCREAAPSVLGLSAIPATGKTTLCRWLRAAAAELGLALETISIDDFYFASPALDHCLAGNPWGVGRALPGSHELDRLLGTLEAWKQGWPVLVPVFDKTLRGGRGDRAGERRIAGRVLLLEGWFLGVPATLPPPARRRRPTDQPPPRRPPVGPTVAMAAIPPSPAEPAAGVPAPSPPLSAAEQAYGAVVLEKLQAYGPVWEAIDRLWRIRPLDFAATALWKRQQTSFTLAAPEAERFVRMILCCLPAGHWQRIPAAVVADIDAMRRLHRIGPVP